MQFQSWMFVLFLAGFYPLWLALKNTPLRLAWLLAGSYLFYVVLNLPHPWTAVVLLYASPYAFVKEVGRRTWLAVLALVYASLFDYLMGRGMDRWGRRRLWLTLSIVNSVALLGFFKYGPFVVENLNRLLALLGTGYALPEPHVPLPVGLSFFVFQSMTYTFDLYRGQVPVERNPLRYAAFVSMFTQVAMGPVERARNILPQLRQRLSVSGDDAAEGA